MHLLDTFPSRDSCILCAFTHHHNDIVIQYTTDREMFVVKKISFFVQKKRTPQIGSEAKLCIVAKNIANAATYAHNYLYNNCHKHGS